MEDVDILIKELKQFSSTYITRDYYQTIVVKKGTELNKRVSDVKSSIMCCGSTIEVEQRFTLEYWDHFVALIVHRMVSKNKRKEKPSWCTSYNTTRYLSTGLPIMVYPSFSKNIVTNISLLMFLVSAGFQLVRVNIDGRISFWSQIAYAIGSLISLTYFAVVGNIEFILPQAGALVVAVSTLIGILRHFQEPWASL